MLFPKPMKGEAILLKRKILFPLIQAVYLVNIRHSMHILNYDQD